MGQPLCWTLNMCRLTHALKETLGNVSSFHTRLLSLSNKLPQTWRRKQDKFITAWFPRVKKLGHFSRSFSSRLQLKSEPKCHLSAWDSSPRELHCLLPRYVTDVPISLPIISTFNRNLESLKTGVLFPFFKKARTVVLQVWARPCAYKYCHPATWSRVFTYEHSPATMSWSVHIWIYPHIHELECSYMNIPLKPCSKVFIY